jgi:uncharacterized protein
MTYIEAQCLLLLVSLSFTSSAFCQSDAINPNSYANKNIFKIPQQRGYVNDHEGLFSKAQQTNLDSLIKKFESKTTIQIVIISIDTTMVTRESFDDYTLRILNTWGVGHKGKNNGVLIGISAGYRMMRIQNGYGIQKILSDYETKQIIDSAFLPSFIEGEMYNGTLKGLIALMEKLK